MDIKIHGDIGGWWDGVSAKDIMMQLATVPEGEEINVSIHSPGGDMLDGIAIYNALKMHPSKVNVTVVGLAASAASLIAMAGDEIRMPENAYLMIHNPWGYVQGESKDFEEAAALFKQFEVTSAKVYARRSGKTLEEIKVIQDAATWIDGATAKESGFCDVVTDAVQIAAFARLPKSMAENCPIKFEVDQEPPFADKPPADEPPVDDPPANDPSPEEPPVVDPIAEAAEIVELCQIAGKLGFAAPWIREKVSAEDARMRLAKMAVENQPLIGNSAAPDKTAELAELAKTNLTVKSLISACKIEEALTYLNK